MNDKLKFIWPSAILSLTMLVCVLIFVGAWKQNRSADQTITVTGSARQTIVSDLAILRGTISVQASMPDAAFRALKSQSPVLLQYLKDKGFPQDKVAQYPVINTQLIEYNNEGHQTGVKGYVCTQRFEIQSADVNRIKSISLDIASVVEKGVYFNVEMPEFYYTKLADIKISIQAEAAKDAQVRAERIAAATGRKLGPLRSARMGVLQITPKNSNVVADYGINDVSSVEKEITAVVSASFQIY
jgi:uncharacterized protein